MRESSRKYDSVEPVPCSEDVIVAVTWRKDDGVHTKYMLADAVNEKFGAVGATIESVLIFGWRFNSRL